MLDGDFTMKPDHNNLVKYNKDGVYIIASITTKVYTISTDKYQLQWNVDTDTLEVFSAEVNSLGFLDYVMPFYMKFDMNKLVSLKDPNESPAMLEIVSASTEHINHQIDRLVNLKAFL
jgi:hypothetical protein